MAMKAWTADAIQGVADDMAFVSKKLGEVAEAMRVAEYPELYLQAEAAFGVYRTTLVKLAGDVETEFRDQFRAAKMGTLARWQINQKVVEARRAAEEDRKAKGIQPKKPIPKKPSKKKRPT